MPFLQALAGLGLLLALGLALRLAVPVLGRLLLPVPLIGGFIGLAAGPHGFDIVPRATMAIWATLPSLLITLVFAGLFLGVAVPSPRAIARLAGPLLRFSLVGALGQYVVALVLWWLMLEPLFHTPALFACLLEVGFSGGHGTASAMTSVFSDAGFPAGGPLGQMSATVGLVVGVVGGVALIQYGARRGVTPHAGVSDSDTGPGAADVSGLLPLSARRPIGVSTISAVVLDPFTWHVAVASLAVLLGMLMLAGLRALHPSLQGMPLFPLAMVGGMLVQVTADRAGAAAYFDRGTFQRLMGLSLDLLVVAAVASMQLDLFWQHLAPFALLMATGIVWCVASFLWLGPRMLREHWFEQAIVVYGTQTGVAAVGLMLLRIVDPQNRTTAAQAFAARSMVISPLLGGGIITATMPMMLQQFGPLPMLAAVTAATAACWLWPGPRAATP